MVIFYKYSLADSSIQQHLEEIFITLHNGAMQTPTPSISEKDVVLRPHMVCRIKVVLYQLTTFWTLMPLDSSVTIRAIKSAPSVAAALRPSHFVAHFSSPSSRSVLRRSLSRHEACLGHGGGAGL